MDGRDSLGVKRGDYAVTIPVGWIKKRPVSLCATTVSNQYHAIFQHLDGIFNFPSAKIQLYLETTKKFTRKND